MQRATMRFADRGNRRNGAVEPIGVIGVITAIEPIDAIGAITAYCCDAGHAYARRATTGAQSTARFSAATHHSRRASVSQTVSIG
ncbi:hypothetical protein A8H40_06385 [Burkholderia multivorans]|nr:hypothetical protein A8H40_06385 [Burkholderia multivorans]PRF29923.1 hypothetical protein C6Q08_23225 [Burkholderia multivorans]PRG95009.1 hypothetical protein C6V04_08850 [Burkholderia multivorans]